MSILYAKQIVRRQLLSREKDEGHEALRLDLSYGKAMIFRNLIWVTFSIWIATHSVFEELHSRIEMTTAALPSPLRERYAPSYSKRDPPSECELYARHDGKRDTGEPTGASRQEHAEYNKGGTGAVQANW